MNADLDSSQNQQIRDIGSDLCVGWEASSRWIAGPKALEVVDLTTLSGELPLVLADSNFLKTESGVEILNSIQRKLSSGCQIIEVSSPPRLDDVKSLAAMLPFKSSLILLGGGSTVDLGVIASVYNRIDTILKRGGFHFGLIDLSRFNPSPNVPRIAIPTTLGTGCEVSRAACLDIDDSKLLLTGSCLAPEQAIIDSRTTQTLSIDSIRQSVVEIFGRVVVPYTQLPLAAVPSYMFDEISLATLRALAPFLNGKIKTGAEERLIIACASSHSHQGWGCIPRRYLSGRIWFVATEMAHVLNETKAQAYVRILPQWAKCVEEGDSFWGDSNRLQQALLTICSSGSSASNVIEGMFNNIGICPREISKQEADTIMYRLEKRWMRRIPVLKGCTLESLESLISGSSRQA